MARPTRRRPNQVGVAGENYRATVLRILTRDEHGRPLDCVVCHDETSVHLEGGEEFMIVYAPEFMLAKTAS